jgi:vacuolar iron transporter family protein
VADGLEEWREEQQSAWLYRRLARRERDPVKATLFGELARAAERQAGIWERGIVAREGAPPGPWRPTLRARVVASLVRTLGGRPIRPILAAMKVRGLSVYTSPRAPEGHAMPTSLSDFGQRHRSVSEGGNLRAAVFGVSDGLVSNTSLILGVAGAGVASETILLSGLAGMLAGAFSMAAGEYVSVRSQRELFEHQIGLERAELEEYPEEETEELALIYQARGLDLERAREMARAVMRDPRTALDTLAREELGLNPDDLGSPWGALASSFAAFAAGAAVPLLPFLLAPQSRPVAPASACAGAALFAVGCGLSLFTGRNALWSGLRMLLIGAAAGAATYLVGTLFGVESA